jgi:hypothetical protein
MERSRSYFRNCRRLDCSRPFAPVDFCCGSLTVKKESQPALIYKNPKKASEDSLHPHPEGWGIRGPLHSHVLKYGVFYIIILVVCQYEKLR